MAPAVDKSSDISKRSHSIPVPQLYKEAVKIFKRYNSNEGSMKTLVYEGRYRDKARMLALLSKVIDNKNAIQNALSSSNILEDNPKFDPDMAGILTCELLHGKGHLPGDSVPITTIRAYEEKLREHGATSHSPDDDNSIAVKFPKRLPRYIRINTLKTSADDIYTQLEHEGWNHYAYAADIAYSDFLQLVETLPDDTFLSDYHIPDLLVFPASAVFWKSKLYKSGSIIIQDKASCLPVFLAGVKPGMHIVDACASPGNKTSLIAALLENDGKVLAIENNSKRYETLVRLVDERKATCVSCLKEDFTLVDSDQLSDYTHIFLDPSCSSSGVNLHQDEVSPSRIMALSAFQLQLLSFALSLPNVQVVVYSTCSIYTEENERVIQKALYRFHDTFELEDIGKKLKGWTNFGSDDYKFGNLCVTTIPLHYLCHGFFVAKFVRKSDECQVDRNKRLKLSPKKKKKSQK